MCLARQGQRTISVAEPTFEALFGRPHFELQAVTAPEQFGRASLRRSTALAVALMLAACTSPRTVPLEVGRAPEGVGPGDTVMVTTVRDQKLQFEVVRVDADALVGEDVRVAFEEIAALEVEQTDPAKTGGAIFGGVAVVVIGALLALGLLIAAADLPTW
jgi:hypothetical protein